MCFWMHTSNTIHDPHAHYVESQVHHKHAWGREKWSLSNDSLWVYWGGLYTLLPGVQVKRLLHFQSAAINSASPHNLVTGQNYTVNASSSIDFHTMQWQQQNHYGSCLWSQSMRLSGKKGQARIQNWFNSNLRTLNRFTLSGHTTP